MVDSSCKMVNNPSHSCKLTNRHGKSSILMVLTRKKDGDFLWAIFKEALYLGGQKACRIQDQPSPRQRHIRKKVRAAQLPGGREEVKEAASGG